MLNRIQPLSAPALIGLVLLASGIGLLVASRWLLPAPAARASLSVVEGIVEQADDVKHYKEPADTSTFAFRVRPANGEPVWVDALKQKVAPDQFRALVGQPVTAYVDDGLAYELKSADGALYSYDDTARVLETDRTIARRAGVTGLVLSTLVLLWGWRRASARR